MKIFLLFYMCHFAMGLTHCYKKTVIFTFITYMVVHIARHVFRNSLMCWQTKTCRQMTEALLRAYGMAASNITSISNWKIWINSLCLSTSPPLSKSRSVYIEWLKLNPRCRQLPDGRWWMSWSLESWVLRQHLTMSWVGESLISSKWISK